MAMSSGHGEGMPMADINTTPLIDVMLVLLVTIILSVPIMTHAVKLDMPPPNPNQPPPPTQPEVVDLDIDYDGTIVWNGQTVPSIAALEQLFQTKESEDPQPEIHLSPDPHAKYGIVARVLAAAQRNHMTKVGFANTTQFSSDE